MALIWQKLGRMQTGEPDATCYETLDGLTTVIVASVPAWHLSISRPDRWPTWDEIREARYRFIPDSVTVCMILPPRSEYVNMHPNCFHLHEHKDPRGTGP